MASRVTSTRDQIVEGAYAALLVEGLPNLSYDRIAQAAGTSRQLVRYHFREPDALMLALCDRLARSYRDALLGAIDEMAADRNRLDLFFDFYFDLLEGRGKPRDDQVYDALMSRAAASEPVRITLRDQYVLLGEVIANEITAAHPSLAGGAAGELSYLFVSLMYGHWRMVGTLGVAEEHRTVSRAAIDRLLESYLRKASPSMAGTQPWAVVDES